MKALTFQGIEKVGYEDVPDPEILSPHDVIVEVRRCAVCGSDLHVYFGREAGIDQHTAMGHEFVGTVVEKGKAVRGIHVGNKVMSPFTTSCGNCFYCKLGLTCRCSQGQLFGWVANGIGLQGAQSELLRVPLAETTLVRIPEGVSMEEGLLLGDVLSTGFFCAQQLGLKGGEVAVVVGCGPVGLMAVLGARHYGAEKVFAIDTVPQRLEMAGHFGATIIDAAKTNAEELVKTATGGRGADGVMEAVGSAAAGKLAYELVRPGGVISSVGVCTDAHLAFTPVQAYDKNLTYKVGRCPARHMMDQLVPLVQQRKFDFTAMISHRMKLSEGAKGYDLFATKKENCLKVVLEP